MHSGQIFTCWVTFCIKLMYNWWKAFIPMSMGNAGPEMNASLVPNDDELDKRAQNYMSVMAQKHVFVFVSKIFISKCSCKVIKKLIR